MSKQPEALRLADDLDRTLCVKHGLRDRNAAAELRRLHAVNAELLQALKLLEALKKLLAMPDFWRR